MRESTYRYRPRSRLVSFLTSDVCEREPTFSQTCRKAFFVQSHVFQWPSAKSTKC